MRAAVLEEFGRPLVIRDHADPAVGTGEIVVEVLAAPVLPYTDEVFSGERPYALVPPVVPGVGGVGRVVAIGPDATRLQPGDLVWCDSTVRSRDDDRAPDITLQGWTARGRGGARLATHFHDGAFAERMAVPTENATPLGPLEVDDAVRRSALGVYLVPYGGLRAAGLRAGATLLVSGATGNFGSAAVAVGLAMGARQVVAAGRNEAVLDDLRRRFGARVRPVVLTGDRDADTERMRSAAGRPIDVVLDLLPPGVSPDVVAAAARTVREYGQVVLMGGVGQQDGAELALPYFWLMRQSVTVRGQWMYPRVAVAELNDLVDAGLLDLGQDDLTTFALEAANDAVSHAAAHGGPFQRTVLTPTT